MIKLHRYSHWIKKAFPYLRKHGFRAFFARAYLCLSGKRESPNSFLSDLGTNVLPEQAALLRPKVVIVAVLSLPQCRHYRVDQKVKMLETAGWKVAVVSWEDTVRALAELQTATLVIAYRLPYLEGVQKVYAEAHRLGLKIGYDVDDLIFEKSEYTLNSNMASLSKSVRRRLLDGCDLNAAALAAADFSIASTPALAAYMQKYCKGPCYVVPNALDGKDASGRYRFPLGLDDEIVIGYGSGTTTHDRDFEVCAPAIERILEEYPSVSLVLHGSLQLPDSFGRFSSRIRRVKFVPFSDYINAVARFDINLAPLERSVFNDCKSNIKFLEAASSGIPTVASPCAEFVAAMKSGENGFLAKDADGWYVALKRLVESSDLRHKIGAAAKSSAEAAYSLASVAKGDFARMLSEQAPGMTDLSRRRILVVNIFYAPFSFGGATILAEKLVGQFAERTDVAVFCCTTTLVHKPGFVIRYENQGVPCFVCEIAPTAGANYFSEVVPTAFEMVLESFRPDVVHFNSIQYMGVEMLDICRQTGTPYLITAHDAWWLCPRQFMLDGNGRYCGQGKKGIDLYRCATCVKDKDLFSRWKLMMDGMAGACAVLTPSDRQRELYVESGVPDAIVRTNRNGIAVPAEMAPHHCQKVLTFAYLGGKSENKGYYLLQRAVLRLHGDWRLKLVDISVLGIRNMSAVEWSNPSRIEVCAPFKPQEMDEFYSGVDVLLFPSYWESFGLTVREALARNIWVIATNAGGDLDRDLHDGENGDLLDIGDEEGFAAAMQRLVDHPERLEGFVNPRRMSITTVARQADEIIDLCLDRLGWRNPDYISPWARQSATCEPIMGNGVTREKYLVDKCRKLEQEVEIANARYDTISSSTCWRVTAPVRFVLDGIKRLLRRLS